MEIDINPSTLANANTSPAGATTTDDSQSTTKPAPILTTSTRIPNRPAQSAPRVDLEPIYTSLKTLIPNNWTTYKSAISRFVLGFLNQDELNRQTAHYIAINPQREHLHNHLLCGIHANILRDAPEAGVASWVSANDKPASVAKPATGDAAEQRLKSEVMQLPPRFRHRMKAVKDEPRQPLITAINLSQSARRLPTTSTSTSTTTNLVATASTTPLTATAPSTNATSALNKDQEIRRRYTAPIISESRDLPPPSALSDRVLPICYEEGLSAGVPTGGMVGELLSTALEFFVKESLGSMLRPTRPKAPVADAATPAVQVNGADKAASALTNGTVNGSTSTLTPVSTNRSNPPPPTQPPPPSQPPPASSSASSAQSKAKQGDLRLAWELGEPWLARLMPWFGERVYSALNGWADGDHSADDNLGPEDPMNLGVVDGAANAIPPLTNGDAAHRLKNPKAPVNGTGKSSDKTKRSGTAEPLQAEPPDDGMMIDEADWGWKGAGAADRDALGGLLDGCLAVGD